MCEPSKRGLDESEVVFGNDGLDDRDGLEVGVAEVSLAVVAALADLGVAEAAGGGDVGGFVGAGEEAAG